jgi:hypothetical protein
MLTTVEIPGITMIRDIDNYFKRTVAFVKPS